jgi:hypothetical protein
MRNFVCLLIFVGACTNNSVDSDTQARRAYLGLDKSISKSLELTFQGYDTGMTNFPPQMTTGDKTGTITVSGKADSGNCSQLSIGINVGMTNYSDGPFKDGSTTLNVTYATSTDTAMQPALGIKLNGSSGNSINATLMGDYTMTGDLKGTVTLDLTIVGTFSGTCPNAVQRVAGSTTVTGTAVNSSGGMYTVNVTI